MKKGQRFDFAYAMDYAEIESDIDYIDLMKVPLYRSEERLFFLDSGEHLIDFLDLIYIRAINNITYGLKYCGKITNISANAFMVKDVEENREYYLLRPKIPLYHGAEVGLLGTYTSAEDTITNTVMSIDGSFPFPDGTRIISQFAYSIMNETEVARDFAYCLNFSRKPTRGFRINCTYAAIRPDFSTLMGFVPLSGLNEFGVKAQYALFMNKPPLTSITLSVSYRYWELNDALYIKDITSSIPIQFINNLTITPYAIVGSLGERENKYGKIDVSYNPGGWNKISLGYLFGKYCDSQMNYPYLSFQYKPFRILECAMDVEYQNCVFRDTVEENLIITFRGGAKVIGSFGIKHFIQWSDITNTLQTNILLKYDFSVFSHIYLGFNQTVPSQEFTWRDILASEEYVILLKVVHCFDYAM